MAYKEDKENRPLRARAEAKTNVRRFVDDVSFVVGKESRNRLKIIHRTLRHHYRDIANELPVRSTNRCSPPSPRRTSKESSATTRSAN